MNLESADNASDKVSWAISIASAVASWLINDLPVILFGTQLSVIVAGFAGSMAIVSFLPPFDSRQKMWTTVGVCTIAAAYLTRLALHLAGLDGTYSLGMAFIVAFLFQYLGTGLVQHSGKIWGAFVTRIRGKNESDN